MSATGEAPARANTIHGTAHHPELRHALNAEVALAALDEQLLLAASRLYAQGFVPERISPAQMAAAGEIVLGAPSFDQARKNLGGWLRGQMERLAKRVSRGEKPRSWIFPLPAEGPAAAPCLGEELLRWIEGELYLPDGVAAELDRLAALQRFWGRFAGFYRYQAAVGSPMALTAHATAGERSTEGLR